MQIVIVGAGSVGSYLAERLSAEGQKVIVIEADASRAAALGRTVKCEVVNANGASARALEKAGVVGAGLLIAVTSSDAVNVLACQAAASLGVPRRVARIEDPALREDVLPQGVDVAIDPVETLSRELLPLVRRVGVSEIVEFAEGQVTLFGGRVQPDAPLDGIALRALRQRVSGWDWIVAALVRDGETIIARGDSMVRAGDHVLVVTSGSSTEEALNLMGFEEHRARKAFVLGGSRLALLTAGLLAEEGISTVLIAPEGMLAGADIPRHRALQVVRGDPTDPKLMEANGIRKADVVFGLSDGDDVNILGCLAGKALGVPTAIARFSRFEYVSLLTGHGIDAGVSTRLAAANEILRLVRRGRVQAVATFQDTAAEAIEIEAASGSHAVGKTLTEIGLPKSAIVGGIVRDRKAFIPHGDTRIEAGDVVIAIALPDAVPAVERLFS